MKKVLLLVAVLAQFSIASSARASTIELKQVSVEQARIQAIGGAFGGFISQKIVRSRCNKIQVPIVSVPGFKMQSRYCMDPYSGGTSLDFSTKKSYRSGRSASRDLAFKVRTIRKSLAAGWRINSDYCLKIKDQSCSMTLRYKNYKTKTLYFADVEIFAYNQSICLDEDALTTGMCDRLVDNWVIRLMVSNVTRLFWEAEDDLYPVPLTTPATVAPGTTTPRTTSSVLAVAPNAPENIVATASSSRVLLTWSNPVPNGSPAITDFLVDVWAKGSSSYARFADGVSSTTSASVTGLAPNTYSFRIAAVNSIGIGAWSSTGDVVVP